MRQRHLLCFAASMALVANKANVGWLVPRQGVPRLPSPVASGRRVAVAVRAVDGTRQPSNTWSKTSTKLIKKAFLCSAFVILSAIGPILFDWVKRHNAGRFPFFVPALVFHAWAIDGLLGLAWAASKGREGLSALWRPDMLWRFFITTSLFVAGDMLSFMSIAHLDVGTFSLVGKALAIILTVLLSRVVLKKGQSPQQYALVVAVAVATVIFCQSEVHARQIASQAVNNRISVKMASSEWYLGLTERSFAVFLTSLAAVLQEQLLTFRPGIPFLVQQSWMSFAAMSLSLFTLRFVYGLPFSALKEGFNNWRALVLLFSYVASGLTTALMVKKLGAVAKSLCVPIYLGGCYFYAVHTGSATFTLQVIAAWATSTACIVLYAISKMKDQKEECKQLTTNACDRTESDSDPEFGFQRGVALPGEKPPDQPET